MDRDKASRSMLVFVVVLLLTLGVVLPAHAIRDRKALLAVADSYVSQEQPDGNFGWAFYLHVAGYVYSEVVSFLMFNLGDIPRGSIIEEATLRLYNAGDVDLEPPMTIRVSAHHCPTNDWTEDDITYNNRPIFIPEPLDTVNITSGLTWYDWDVTSPSQSVLDKTDKRLSLTLKTDDSIGDTFYSRTSPAVDWRPELSVLYSYTPSSGIDPILFGLTAVGIVGVSGVGLGLVYIRRKRRKQP